MRKRLILSALFAVSAVSICFSSASAKDRAPHPRQAVVDSLLRAAQERTDAGRAADALPPLGQVCAIDPKNDQAYLKLGDAHLLLKNLNEARAAFDRALSLRRSARAYDGIGRVLMEGNVVRTRQAVDYFRDALTLDWNAPEVHYHLALALWKLKDLDALSVMERAHKMRPDDPRIHLLLAEWYQFPPPDLPKAIHWYGRYLRARPDDLDAAHRLGDLYLRGRQYDRARDHATALLAKRPDRVQELPVLALTYLGQDDFEKAEEVFSAYLSKVDPAERAWYEDIRLVGTPDEAAACAATSGEERRDFLLRFWTAHNPTPAEPVNRRRLEHYRRVWVARARHGEKQTPWDRRGEVYIRYGEPDYRSRSDEVDYRKALDPRVERIKNNLRVALYGTPAPAYGSGFEKSSFNPRSGLKVIEPGEFEKAVDQNALTWGPVYPVRSLATLEEDRAGDRTEGTLERRAARSVAASGDNQVPWESWIYLNVSGGIEITFTDERMDGRYDYAPVPLELPVKDIRMNLVTHSPQATVQRAAAATPSTYQPDIAGTLAFGTCAAGFRGQDGRTRLEVYTGVPLSEIAYSQKDSGQVASVERSVALFDGHWREVGRGRDLLSFADSSVSGKGPGAFIPDLKAFELLPGDYHLAVQVTDRTTLRFQAYRQVVRVDPYGTETLQVSDLLLAAQIVPDAGVNPFVKNGLRVLPMPFRAYGLDQDLFLYAEVYNLKPDTHGWTRYRVDYTLHSKEGGLTAAIFSGLGRLLKTERRKGEITVSYESGGMKPTGVLHVSFHSREAGPGDYLLRVDLTDLNTGAKAGRETAFWIRK